MFRHRDVLEPNDRVSSEAVGWFSNPSLPRRTGVVVERYAPAQSHARISIVSPWWLYVVRWDDGKIDRGNLRVGLRYEPSTTPFPERRKAPR